MMAIGAGVSQHSYDEWALHFDLNSTQVLKRKLFDKIEIVSAESSK